VPRRRHGAAPYQRSKKVAGRATLLAVSATQGQPVPSLQITIDATDPERIAAFWCEALGYRRLYERPPYVVCAPPDDDPRPRLNVQQVSRRTEAKPTVHLDLVVADAQAEVERLTAFGARVVDEVDERHQGGSCWTVLVDPQGTPFCVVASRS